VKRGFKPLKQRIVDKVWRLKHVITKLDRKLQVIRKAIEKLERKLKKAKDEFRSTQASVHHDPFFVVDPEEIEELEVEVEAYENELKALNHELNDMVDDYGRVSDQLKKTVHDRKMCNLIYALDAL